MLKEIYLIIKKKKIIQRNNYNKTNKKSINYNSDSDIKKSYPYFTQDNKSNINKEFMSKKEMDNICNSLLERTKKLCVKLKKFCENN